jgi:dolichol-phosphate mannosyltransferase
MSGTVPELSIVVPCFNESEALPTTLARILAVAERLSVAGFEIIIVDDGSTDTTASIIDAASSEHHSIVGVFLSRNFGHSAAVCAGIATAKGSAVILIDADLQDPPELIEQYVEQWRAGAQVVYGVRRSRNGETAFKLATAALYYRLLQRLSDVPIPRDTGDFRLMDRCVVDALLTLPEKERFVRGLVAWVGFRQVGVEYDRAARMAGESKYPLRKMLRFAVSGILSFSSVPLRAASWIGFATCGVSVIGIVYALFQRLALRSTVPGWAATFIAVLFLAGVQLLTVGIIGEYLAKVFTEVKQRPQYIVARQTVKRGSTR